LARDRLHGVPIAAMLTVRSTIVLLTLVFAAATALAQGEFDQISGLDSIVAQTQQQVGDSHRIAFGSVELTLGDTKLYADHVDVYTDKDLIVAGGNVALVQMTNRITADSAEFNYKTRLGVFHTAYGIATIKPQVPRPGAIAIPSASNQDTDVIFVGEVIEKIGPRKYKITNGGFTTCVQPTPRWELRAGTVVLNIEHYTFLRNAVFNVKGVPLLYAPVMYYPTKKDDRATGFLLPTVGTTTLRGESIHNGFFWVLNRSQDATFMHDWFSKTGQGYGSEYRYNYGATETGYLRAYTLREHSAEYVADDGTPQVNQGGTSYQVQGAATQLFPANIMTRARVDYFSSLASQQSFNTNYVNAYSQTRQFGANAVGAWRTYTMNATVDHTDSFSSQTASATYGSWPKISFSRNERVIPGTPLYFSVGSEYAGLLRSAKDTLDPTSGYNQDVTRFDFNPQIRFPFKKWQWFTVNSTLSWRDTYYSRSLVVTDPLFGTTAPSAVDEPLNRKFFTLQTQIVGPVFNKIWDTPENGYAEKFKHTIEPTLTVSRTSAIDDFNNIIKIDGTDNYVGGVTQLTYGVNNRFYAKRPTVPGQRSQALEILDVSITQSHYSNAQAAFYDPQYATSSSAASLSNFSPIELVARAMPTSAFNANVTIDVDSRYLKLRQLAASGSYNWSGRLQTTLGWSKQGFIPQLPAYSVLDNLMNTVNGGANFHTRDNHYGSVYNFTYDATHGTMLQQSISAFYNSQCCGVAFQYQSFNFGGITSGLNVSADHRFFLSFTLAGLGNFSPFNGAMSGLPR
jgi:LPS-assembly protein